MYNYKKEVKMKKNILLKSSALVLAMSVTSAMASPVIMQGDFISTAVSDDGTLGFGGTTPPGLLHDATGTGTFADDYLTPGSPWEIFSISSDQSGLLTNNNDGSDDMSGTLTDISGASVYDNAVNWSATIGSLFTVSTDTYFNQGDERISFSTTISALVDLSNLTFLRAIDPDPDFASGSHDTDNGRGFGSLLPQDWVHSVGTVTGLTLGLFSDSSVTHNTGISEPWSDSPDDYLAGTDDGNGDNAIGIAFDIGSLLAGTSTTFDYHYVMGDQIDTVDIPVDVPEPTTLAVFSLGLLGLGLRRKKQ